MTSAASPFWSSSCCETDQVQPGRIFKPKGEYTGPRLGAFNVRGAQLARHDFIEHQIRGERLENGGQSAVTLRVVNVLPYTVLKIFAFQDRHGNKDAYDLVFTLLNHQVPRAGGQDCDGILVESGSYQVTARPASGLAHRCRGGRHVNAKAPSGPVVSKGQTATTTTPGCSQS